MIKEKILKEFKKHPYLKFGEHEDLKALCVCGGYFCFDEDDEIYDENNEFDELSFVVPKNWLFDFVTKEFEIEDVQYWLENEYTSDNSIWIFDEAMEQSQIVFIDFN